jgi:hypothetical protein
VCILHPTSSIAFRCKYVICDLWKGAFPKRSPTL